MMYPILFLFLLVAASCNNTDLQQTDTRSDTSMRSIDSSAIINENTPLPRDSSATGVQH